MDEVTANGHLIAAAPILAAQRDKWKHRALFFQRWLREEVPIFHITPAARNEILNYRQTRDLCLVAQRVKTPNLKPFRIYRVYEHYHYDAGHSGTIEYGTYSNAKTAAARVAALWAEKKYPETFDSFDFGARLHYSPGYSEAHICVEEIVLNQDIDEEHIGST